MDESGIQRAILIFNSTLMLIHQVRISDALQDLRDALAKKKLNKK